MRCLVVKVSGHAEKVLAHFPLWLDILVLQVRGLLFLCLPDVATIVKDYEKSVVPACEGVKRLSAEVQLQELILDCLLNIACDDSIGLAENDSFSST